MKKKILTVLISMICAFAFAQNNMVAYQYWFDTASTNKVTVAITPQPVLNLTNTPVSVSSLSTGEHILYLRMSDSKNNWSSVVYRRFNVPDASAIFNLVVLRYWTDVSGAYPNDMQEINFTTPQTEITTNLILDFCQSTIGSKKIYFQMKDNNGNWSSVEYRTSNIVAVGPPAPFSISNTADTLYAPSYLGLQWYYLHGAHVPGSGSAPLYPLTSDSTYYAVITNECGSAVSGDSLLYYNPSTGIKENTADINMNLYPNPAHDKATLQLSALPQGNTTLQITNALGQVLETRTLTNQTTQLSFHNPAGIYFIILASDNGTLTKRLIIE